MNSAIQSNVAHCATNRAHLYGAEFMLFKKQSEELFVGGAESKQIAFFVKAEHNARHRYWRELAAAHRISGMPWPEAEKLGGVA